MVFDFDLRLFCENLKATKPPYECPAPGCGRVYKTYIGIQFHLFNYDHENPDSKSSSTAGNSDRSKQHDGLKKAHHRQVRSPSSPSRVNQEESEHELSASNQSSHNVSLKSQRIVEVNLDGRIHHVDVYEPMNVVVRQLQVSDSAESADKKPSEMVACTTSTPKTIAVEHPTQPMIADTVSVIDKTDVIPLLTAETDDKNHASETGFSHYVAHMPDDKVMAFGSDPETAECSSADADCNDVKVNDANKDACLTVPTSVHLLGNSLSESFDPVVHTAVAGEVKSDVEDEVVAKPSAECVEKNIPCCDDITIPLTSAALTDSDVFKAQEQPAECSIVNSCDRVTTSAAVDSKSAPTKLSLPSAEFKVIEDYVRPPKIAATSQRPEYYKFSERTAEELNAVIEYDMDEEVNIVVLY